MTKQPFKSVSTRLYAIKPSGMIEDESFQAHDGRMLSWYTLPAVWYKKKNGTVYACCGVLRTILTAGLTTKDVIEQAKDNDRCSANLEGRYDGKNFWGTVENLDQQKGMIELLKPMLLEAPNLPTGYDGWYRL